MRVSFLKFLAPAAVCLIVSGCGGGSTGGGGGTTGGGGGGGGGNGGGGGSTPTTVTVSFAGTPTALATQVGSGSFTTATLTSGTLTLNIPSGTTNFAVAYVCSTPSSTMQTVLEASTLDGTSYSASYCPSNATVPTATLTGSGDASAIAVTNFLGVTTDNGSSLSQSVLLMGNSEAFSVVLPSRTDRVAVAAYNIGASIALGVPSQDVSLDTLLAVRNFD